MSGRLKKRFINRVLFTLICSSLWASNCLPRLECQLCRTADFVELDTSWSSSMLCSCLYCFTPISHVLQLYKLCMQGDGNFTEDGITIEPFNLKQEREEGYFDGEGNYVEYRLNDDDKVELCIFFVLFSLLSVSHYKHIPRCETSIYDWPTFLLSNLMHYTFPPWHFLESFVAYLLLWSWIFNFLWFTDPLQPVFSTGCMV